MGTAGSRVAGRSTVSVGILACPAIDSWSPPSWNLCRHELAPGPTSESKSAVLFSLLAVADYPGRPRRFCMLALAYFLTGKRQRRTDCSPNLKVSTNRGGISRGKLCFGYWRSTGAGQELLARWASTTP